MVGAIGSSLRISVDVTMAEGSMCGYLSQYDCRGASSMSSVVMRRQYKARWVVSGGIDLRVGPVLAGVRKGSYSLICLERDMRNEVARVKVDPVERDWGRKVKQGLSPVISRVKGAMRRRERLAMGSNKWKGLAYVSTGLPRWLSRLVFLEGKR